MRPENLDWFLRHAEAATNRDPNHRMQDGIVRIGYGNQACQGEKDDAWKTRNLWSVFTRPQVAGFNPPGDIMQRVPPLAAFHTITDPMYHGDSSVTRLFLHIPGSAGSASQSFRRNLHQASTIQQTPQLVHCAGTVVAIAIDDDKLIPKYAILLKGAACSIQQNQDMVNGHAEKPI